MRDSYCSESLLAVVIFVWFCNWNHTYKCCWYFIMILVCISLINNNINYPFICWLAIYISSLIKWQFSFFPVIFSLCCLFSSCLIEFFICCGNIFIRYLICKYFLLAHDLNFHSFNGIFHREKDFNFDEVQLTNFFLYGVCF